MTQTTQRPEPDLQSSWPATPAGPPPEGRSPFAFLRELPALIAIAFAVAILLKTFLLQAFFIPSGSMLPTLAEDDRVVVNKLAYRFREPRRGEVIVFVAERFDLDRNPFQRAVDFLVEGLGIVPPRGEKDFIKRVVGLPGETILVNDRGVFITPADGSRRFRLRESYIMSRDAQGPSYGPFEIPEDHYFVMGDNRANSSDSRAIGPVARDDIIGKAFVLIWTWPLDVGRMGTIDAPDPTPRARQQPPEEVPEEAPEEDRGPEDAASALPSAALIVVGLGVRRRLRA